MVDVVPGRLYHVYLKLESDYENGFGVFVRGFLEMNGHFEGSSQREVKDYINANFVDPSGARVLRFHVQEVKVPSVEIKLEKIVEES